MAEAEVRSTLARAVATTERVGLWFGIGVSLLLAMASVWIASVDVARFAADVDDLRGRDASYEILRILVTYLLAGVLVAAASWLHQMSRAGSVLRPGGGAPAFLRHPRRVLVQLVLVIVMLEMLARVSLLSSEGFGGLAVLGGAIAVVSLLVARKRVSGTPSAGASRHT